MQRVTALIVIKILLFSSILIAQNSPQVQIYNTNWVATDALGRKIPMGEETGPARPDKYVGVFYFLWHGFHPVDTIYDNTKIIRENPVNPQYGFHHTIHWWGEPEAGYYRAKDPWVIRRNLQMLSNAGVDFIFLDATNAFTYLEEAFELCKISLGMREEGLQTPYLLFHTYASSAQTINKLYDNFYNHFEYQDLWFRWHGKPLIFGDKNDPGIYPEALEFFNFRFSWAWTPNYGPHLWRWLDHTPQRYGWDDNPSIPEQISVSVAEHATTNIGSSYSGDYGNGGSQPPINQYKLTEFTGQGLFFADQWERAHEVDPKVVMITGWNEWVALRMIEGIDVNAGFFLGQPLQNGDTYFVDAYNQEYNRDIEPMKGGHTDNRYYQMVSNIRRFKGMSVAPHANSMNSINIDSDFSDWINVGPVFIDPSGDTFHRYYNRIDNGDVYTNNTGRNDIIESRVAFDSINIYFYVKTSKSLTEHTNTNWMLLFINSDNDNKTGWQGYDFLINKSPINSLNTTLHGWHNIDSTWTEIKTISYSYDESQMEICVPRADISLTDSTPNFQFHWVDNIQKLDDISEFFINGDSAPDRRFNYYFASTLEQGSSEPNAPTNLVCKALSGTEIKLSWTDNSVNEESFIIERSDNFEGVWEEISIINANVTVFIDSSLESNKTYYYRIYALNGYGKSPYSNVSSATTYLAVAPDTPTNIIATPISINQIDLTWSDKSNNSTGYFIKIREKNNSQWISRVTGNTFYSAKALKEATGYYFRICAFNDIGYSDYSDSILAFTLGANKNTWDFLVDSEGWRNTSPDIYSFGWEESGIIRGYISGPNPHITSSDNLEISIDQSKYVIINLKNEGPSQLGKIFFTTTLDTTFDDAKSSVANLVSNDSTFREYIFDVSKNDKWGGLLKQLRFVPSVDVTSGKFYIDFINIQDVITSANYSNNMQNPSHIELYNNYPNPFNSYTKIRFYLPEPNKVNLIIYDILGKQVKTVINDYRNEGLHEIIVGCEKLSSGVYFYVLHVDAKIYIKKLIFLQ